MKAKLSFPFALAALAALATFAFACALAGCWLVVGESFDGYSVASDASADAMSDRAIDARTCTPACTGANMICDPADGKCKLDGTTSHVGERCNTQGTSDPLCGTAPNHSCKEQGSDGYPGGYCTITSCDENTLCPIGATCAYLTGETSEPDCYKICQSIADCRTPGYDCFDLGTLYRSGAGTKICHPLLFMCQTSADCPPAKPTCATDGGPSGFCGN